MNIYLNIHCKYLHEYSHDIRPGYQGNAPGLDKLEDFVENLKQGWSDEDED